MLHPVDELAHVRVRRTVAGPAGAARCGWRPCAGAPETGPETRLSWGRGECSSRPYLLSTSVQRNWARSPSTRTHAVYSSLLALEVVQPGERASSRPLRGCRCVRGRELCRSSICLAKLKNRRSAKPSSRGSRGMIIGRPSGVGNVSRALVEKPEVRLSRDAPDPPSGPPAPTARRVPDRMPLARPARPKAYPVAGRCPTRGGVWSRATGCGSPGYRRARGRADAPQARRRRRMSNPGRGPASPAGCGSPTGRARIVASVLQPAQLGGAGVVGYASRRPCMASRISRR